MKRRRTSSDTKYVYWGFLNHATKYNTTIPPGASTRPEQSRYVQQGQTQITLVLRYDKTAKKFDTTGTFNNTIMWVDWEQQKFTLRHSASPHHATSLKYVRVYKHNVIPQQEDWLRRIDLEETPQHSHMRGQQARGFEIGYESKYAFVYFYPVVHNDTTPASDPTYGEPYPHALGHPYINEADLGVR